MRVDRLRQPTLRAACSRWTQERAAHAAPFPAISLQSAEICRSHRRSWPPARAGSKIGGPSEHTPLCRVRPPAGRGPQLLRCPARRSALSRRRRRASARHRRRGSAEPTKTGHLRRTSRAAGTSKGDPKLRSTVRFPRTAPRPDLAGRWKKGAPFCAEMKGKMMRWACSRYSVDGGRAAPAGGGP